MLYSSKSVRSVVLFDSCLFRIGVMLKSSSVQTKVLTLLVISIALHHSDVVIGAGERIFLVYQLCTVVI